MERKNFLDFRLDEFAFVVENTDVVKQIRNVCKYASNVTRFIYFALSNHFNGKLSEEQLLKYKLIERGTTTASIGALEVVLYNTFRVNNIQAVHENVALFMEGVQTIGSLLEKLIKEEDNNESISDFYSIKKLLSDMKLEVVIA